VALDPPSFRRYDLLVFDLDGTLADTRQDLARSVNHALASLGRPPLGLETIVRYVGNGARRLLERALGEAAGPEQVEAALASFLGHYRVNCLVDTRLYPGVHEALERLESRRLAVLSNKPLGPSRTILAGLGILKRFERVEGGDSVPAKKPEPGGLLGLLEAAGVSPERALMVGDSAVDVQTARAAGVPVAGVSYGFRPEDFAAHPPDFLVHSLTELAGGR
jgi:phosphoglycolate phosphatase